MIWKEYTNFDTLRQVLFTLLVFCVALNLYLFLSASILLYILFSLLFVISASSQCKFFSAGFFCFTLLQKFLPYSVCTYMCTYIFLEFY